MNPNFEAGALTRVCVCVCVSLYFIMESNRVHGCNSRDSRAVHLSVSTGMESEQDLHDLKKGWLLRHV